MILVILLIYFKNRMGSKTQPWSTPKVTGKKLLVLPVSSITWLLMERYASVQVIIVEFKRNPVIYPTNSLGTTRRNAFGKSIQIRCNSSFLMSAKVLL